MTTSLSSSPEITAQNNVNGKKIISKRNGNESSKDIKQELANNCMKDQVSEKQEKVNLTRESTLNENFEDATDSSSSKTIANSFDNTSFV